MEGSPAFSTTDARGERVGYTIDQCRILAAAIFGAFNIEFVPITPQTGFLSLQTRRIDILAAGATWTYTRDVTLGLDYAGVSLYNGQGFLVRRDAGVSSPEDLDGATVCMAQGTTAELNLADYFGARGVRYTPLTFANIDKALRAYDDGRCDAVTTEQISLAGHATRLHDPGEHVVLAQVISREPTGALVRQGDDRWRDVAFWAFNATIAAEELGIDMANVERMRRESNDAQIRRLLGVTGDFGAVLGLSNDWAYDVIRLVGNANDIWTRHFSPLGLQRGANGLWRDGGLLGAMPFR
jgi:general L-amino acid transport system substrate-binding protein